MEREFQPPQEGDIEPSQEEVNEYLNRLEDDLVLSPSGHHKKGPARFGIESTKETRSFYEAACEKAKSFLSEIDPDLTVSVQSVDVTLGNDAGNGYRTLALRFEHRTKPYLKWTMEIEESERYINDELEGVVRDIYNRKARGM